jgi:hypothetical protein
MKTALYMVPLAVALLAAGCSDSPKPVASGLTAAGMIWKYPLGSSPSNEGEGIPKDARVDVYERLIIVHRADGSKQVAPLDRVSDLRLK